MHLGFSCLILLLRIPWSQASPTPPTCPIGCECVRDPVLPTALTLFCNFPQALPERLDAPMGTRTLVIQCTDPLTIHSANKEEELFAAVPSLHTLTIKGCHVGSSIFRSFAKLTNLRGLHLEEIGLGETRLELHESDFEALSKLEKLEISTSFLASLPERMFCHLPHLMVLNVTGNTLSQLDFTADCPSKLIIADFSGNRFKKLDGHSLSFLPSIRQLSFARCLLSTIESEAFTQLSLLQQLDLESNRLEEIPGLPETLVHVSLARNEFRKVPVSLKGLAKLVSLNFSQNAIEIGPDDKLQLATSELETLDLSYNRFSNLPSQLILNSIGSLINLHLDGNRLKSLNSGDFQGYSKLQTLSLDGNSLTELRDEVFRGLISLAELSMANNSIQIIEIGVFNDMQIAELDLSSNSLTEASLALGNLRKLIKLNLRNNKISRLFMTVFNRSPILHQLDLSGNELHMISNYVFSDCPSLKILNLSRNKITQIETDALIKVPHLHLIDLSDNRLRGFDGLDGISNLRVLNVSHNHIEVMQWDTLPNRLEHIYADGNRITLLGAATQSSRIKSATFRENHIERLTAEQIPDSIEKIDFTSNRIRSIANETFRLKTRLLEVKLGKNLLETLDIGALGRSESLQPLQITLSGNPLSCSCELDWIGNKEEKRILVIDKEETFCRHPIDQRRISIGGVQAKELLCSYERMCEPGCRCCDFSSCDCKSVCPRGCRCFRDSTFSTNVVRCDGTGNKNKTAISPRDIPMTATHIHLWSQSLPILKAHSFLGRKKLIHLQLNSSRIKEIEPSAFNTLPNLEILDLSDNELEKVTGEEMLKTFGVKQLNLHGNRLRTLEPEVLMKLPKLEKITLHNNLLEDVPLSISKANGLAGLSLSANPLRCDCGDRFLAPYWIFENKQKILDYPRVLCVENVTRAFRENDTTALSGHPPNLGDDLFTMPLDDFIGEVNRTLCVPFEGGLFGAEPSSSLLIGLLVLLTLLLVIGFIALGMARKAHNSMAQRRYKATSSLNCSSTTGSSPLPVPLISYDAFVSYARKDEKMVEERICRPLEEEDYHLCLLHRDGPTYNPRVHTIQDELIAQMESAQCLILVLTKNFLENEWTTLQIKTSHQLFSRNRAKRVIAILDSDVDTNLLDDVLGGMLRQNDWIKMNDHLFWTLLRSKLPLRSPTQQHSSGGSNTASQVYSDLYGPVPSEIL